MSCFPSLNDGDLSLCAEMMSKIPLDEMTRSKHRPFRRRLSLCDRMIESRPPLSERRRIKAASLDVSGISIRNRSYIFKKPSPDAAQALLLLMIVKYLKILRSLPEGLGSNLSRVKDETRSISQKA